MAKKIEILEKALIVTDTVSGLIELSQPPVRTWYKESDLKNGRISFYDLDSTEEISGSFSPIALSDAVNSSLVAFSEATFRTFCIENLGFNPGGTASLPTDEIFNGGFVDYNDSGGSISVTVAGSPVVIPNDGAGAFTIKTYLPNGVTDIYDEVDSFDWSQLKLGDMVDIRLDLVLTTTSVNTEITIKLHLGTGGGAYTIPFITETNFKNTGSHDLIRFNGIYMGDNNTLDNGGQFKISTDKDCSIVVNGWYCKIIRLG